MQHSERQNESERTLPPKISRVGAAADSVVVVVVVVVVVSAVAEVVVVVVVVVVEEGEGAAMGASVGASMVGASAEVGGVMDPVSVGLIANRSSSGAMLALPSVVAKGSSGAGAAGFEGSR